MMIFSFLIIISGVKALQKRRQNGIWLQVLMTRNLMITLLGVASPNHVEEARTALLAVEASKAQEVFLSMASNLGWSSCSHIVSGDASPVSFAQPLKADQKCSMFLFCPWNSLLSFLDWADEAIREITSGCSIRKIIGRNQRRTQRRRRRRRRRGQTLHAKTLFHSNRRRRRR